MATGKMRHTIRIAICFFLFAATALTGLQAQVVQGLDASRVASGLTQPLFVTAPPGDSGRLFIVQKDGRIRILNLATGTLYPTPFLTLTGLATGGEQGLLGMAFDPSYAANGKFYLNFTIPGGAFGNGVTHVSQFTVSGNPNVADPASERILLTFDQPQSNHNGGWIGFSPRAGDANNLYVATGDGGAGNDQGTGHIEPGGNAQNLTTLLGKMLRIQINSAAGTYTIPPDNPFVGVAGARGEIWARGLRNPFRNSFDRQTGRMFIGDVGQGTREEIDVQQATNPSGGENYGWRVREGSVQNPAFPGVPTPPGAIDPILDYPRSTGRTVVGGYVYRGQQIPILRGVYVFADFLGPESGPGTGEIFTVNYNGIVASNFQNITGQLFPTRVGGFTLSNPSSLGEDANGELYITDISNGSVFKITGPAGSIPAATRASVTDFNSDGSPDYLLRNASTRQTAIWYLSNNLFVGSAYGPTLVAGWALRVLGDFNRDSHSDYALFAPNTKQTALWYLSGPTFIGSAYGPTLPAGWELIGAADFNGDNYPDYVLYNTLTRQTAIWYMNNNVHVGGGYGPTLPPGWNLIGIGDFNGDRHPDYAVVYSVTGDTAIGYLSGLTLIGAASAPTIPGGWALGATADFNHDGKPDYVLYKSSTRQTAIWYLNNNVFISSAYGPTLPAGWSLVGQ
jgi:glucose/arabinose dehydrogenase